MTDIVRRINQKRPYCFVREVVRLEHFVVQATTETEARRLLEKTDTPLRACMWDELVGVSGFTREKPGQ